MAPSPVPPQTGVPCLVLLVLLVRQRSAHREKCCRRAQAPCTSLPHPCTHSPHAAPRPNPPVHPSRYMSEDEFQELWRHFSEHDYPETLQTYDMLLGGAGFQTPRLLFKDDVFTWVVAAQH
jgi:hypothetical protein